MIIIREKRIFPPEAHKTRALRNSLGLKQLFRNSNASFTSAWSSRNIYSKRVPSKHPAHELEIGPFAAMTFAQAKSIKLSPTLKRWVFWFGENVSLGALQFSTQRDYLQRTCDPLETEFECFT
jgi:hypothetical protein